MVMWSARPHETAGRGAGVGAVAERLDARDKGVPVALGPLDETAAVHRQIVAHLRHVQAQALVVDDVDVGFQGGLSARSGAPSNPLCEVATLTRCTPDKGAARESANERVAQTIGVGDGDGR
jgi:hypothetical protein